MTGSPVLLAEIAGPVAALTLNRPAVRNALDGPLIGALREALARADADDDVRVVTLAGAGKDFCAGADLVTLRRSTQASVIENVAEVDALARLFLQLRSLRKPVVARVHGRALGGGCGLATACDLVLAAEGARFGYPEVHLGFVPAMVMAILRRNVSEKRAFEMMALGQTYSAAEAERVGLANRVFADHLFTEEADAFVAALADRSASAILLGKRLLYQQDGMTFENALRAGADVNVIARMTDATREGIAAFLERREEG